VATELADDDGLGEVMCAAGLVPEPHPSTRTEIKASHRPAILLLISVPAAGNDPIYRSLRATDCEFAGKIVPGWVKFDEFSGKS